MTEQEIFRRLRALRDMPPEDRPIGLTRLAQLAGMDKDNIKQILKGTWMHERTRIRLSRALEWLENDQVVIERVFKKRTVHSKQPDEVKIRPPQPPQVTVRRVKFTPSGPRVQFVALNPLKFEKLSES